MSCWMPICAPVLGACAPRWEPESIIFKHFGATSVKRYELPNLMALNFVIQNALGGGVNSSLRLDRHGKTLSSYLLYNLILDVSLDMMPDNSPYREKFK